jgi:hypothetical protein
MNPSFLFLLHLIYNFLQAGKTWFTIFPYPWIIPTKDTDINFKGIKKGEAK